MNIPVILAAAVLALSGCASQQPGAVPSTPSNSRPAPTPSTVITTPRSAPQPPVQQPTPQPPAGLRFVHSPGVVAWDEHLQPGQCAAKVIDAAAGLVLPDPACTPGAVDPDVTTATLQTTICKTGYTATVRPPASETNKFKAAALAAYGMAADPSIELDHLIPLELGGANSASNLWPEMNRAGATGTTNPKDALENRLHMAVCSGALTLETAQQIILDWAHNL
ncbi:HNH endonuclease signature motif containing protein [Arthrobacter sp. MMS18-M83]|uniref:HNH endonuclease signature motif containing protein n=1 Tax=Arthrobacter sp. MMS18-M83 TaxID=2996261 RepID=UPI002279F4C8|nr:HNH endonuclease signature motif containing protein [Arthrobacter sp. MMS18-M83]WAH96329.1 HNH endonuclease signature motif containing protein [Arthrobacter sp. MMS18-M83]